MGYKNIYPLPYSIPLEKIRPLGREKEDVLSPMIPGDKSTYIYKTEKEYYDQYEKSMYAYTKKKFGWDCLRHYEILASNCIPLFPNLENCPKTTMVNFPKKMLGEIFKYVDKDKKKMPRDVYNRYLEKLHNYTKENLTCEASAKYFLGKIDCKKDKPKILMINNNLIFRKDWVNYSQNLLTIGLRNVLKENFIDYPKNEIMYKNFDGMRGYGGGFTYSRNLDNIEIDRTNIEERIRRKEFDYIIFGLMGESEKRCGDIRLECPYWNLVKNNYKSDNIIFIYGGDKMHCKKRKGHFDHLIYHSRFGKCFVRELDL